MTQPRPPADGTTALEAAFEAHHASVYRAAYRVTGSAADAEDVLQTVYLRLVSADESKLTAGYLVRSAVNASLDLLRSRGLRKAAALDEERDRSPDSESPHARHEARETRRALREALAEISPKLAEVFVLRHVEGLPPREISAITGSSAAVVAIQILRAKTRLRLLLRDNL
ncbi:MAG: RNA polymerase sigma factor [Thermoanaerobaculia bacterium]